jgi:hypothetical protein
VSVAVYYYNIIISLNKINLELEIMRTTYTPDTVMHTNLLVCSFKFWQASNDGCVSVTHILSEIKIIMYKNIYLCHCLTEVEPGCVWGFECIQFLLFASFNTTVCRGIWYFDFLHMLARRIDGTRIILEVLMRRKKMIEFQSPTP